MLLRARGLLSPFQTFVRLESAGGILLIATAVVAFAWANSGAGGAYQALKDLPFGIDAGDWGLHKPLLLWVNDGLMAIFFLLVGLEIKRELLVGELADRRSALLPMVAAVGGMVVPALLYVAVNAGGAGTRGWGIPMATDIAFALGVMALLGKRVPLGLKIFLTALAIVDDLGAVLVIAVFYTSTLKLPLLLGALGVWAAAVAYGVVGGRKIPVFLLFGVVLWYLMLKSGVHATVAGVLLAFAIPLRRELDAGAVKEKLSHLLLGRPGESFEHQEVELEHIEDIVDRAQSPLHTLEHALEPWVAFFIMPVFALFNAGFRLADDASLGAPVALGAFVGLLVGKPLGVVLASWLAVRSGAAALPRGVGWGSMWGTGLLAGIGFTMSLFVGALAFGGGALLDQAKLGVLSASVVAALTGLVVLGAATRKAA